MENTLEILNGAFPFIHSIIFVIGASSNVSLLLAAFYRTPQKLKTYSIMIKVGTINDLIAIVCDFLTMQRLLVVPGNIIYLSLGPCSLISAGFCYFIHSILILTLLYSLYVMTASFAYRLWVLHRTSPSNRSVVFLMIVMYFPPAIINSTFTWAQADDSVVRAFLLKNAPHYLREDGALTGHSGFTPHLIFTILVMIGSPWPLYVVILTFRLKILSKLRRFSTGMSERTKSMHRSLVRALTIHAMLPPIYFVGVTLYLVLYFDIYRHPALEKAIYT
ncbi:hypothetical protein PMAYCL1PPCAC_05779, partial [Pristionchus mayeri]